MRFGCLPSYYPPTLPAGAAERLGHANSAKACQRNPATLSISQKQCANVLSDFGNSEKSRETNLLASHPVKASPRIAMWRNGDGTRGNKHTNDHGRSRPAPAHEQGHNLAQESCWSLPEAMQVTRWAIALETRRH